MDIFFVNNLKQLPIKVSLADIIDFIFVNMGKYRDSKTAIYNAIEYATSSEENRGGGIFAAVIDGQLVGLVVVNYTGMHEYIPEYFFVYVVVKREYQGKGIGSKLLFIAINECKGNIALHVEYDNVAKKLYEKIGFTNKYAEMRLEKE